MVVYEANTKKNRNKLSNVKSMPICINQTEFIFSQTDEKSLARQPNSRIGH